MDVSRWTTSLRSALCGPEGATGRVVLSSILGGGIFMGGLLIAGSALLGIGSVGLHLLLAPALFVLGSLLGVVQGFALAFLGRNPSEPGRQCMRRALIGAVVALPLLPLSWLVSSSIAVGTALRVEMHLSWLVVSATASLVGVLVCAWTAHECVRMTGRILVRILFGLLVLASPLSVGVTSAQAVPGASAQATDTVFRHDRHAAYSCLDCHAMQPRHGVLVVRNTTGCRSCHHSPQRVTLECAYCHGAEALGDLAFPQTLRPTYSVGEGPVERSVDFSHAEHEEPACAECHVAGPDLAPVGLDCASCHEDHHATDNEGCWRCHQAPPDEAHPPEVHLTCSGSGCHVDPPITRSPPTGRTGCLWCHEEQRDHEPEGACTDCHAVTRSMVPMTLGYAGVRFGRGDSPHALGESPPLPGVSRAP